MNQVSKDSFIIHRRKYKTKLISQHNNRNLQRRRQPCVKSKAEPPMQTRLYTFTQLKGSVLISFALLFIALGKQNYRLFVHRYYFSSFSLTLLILKSHNTEINEWVRQCWTGGRLSKGLPNSTIMLLRSKDLLARH